MAVPSHPHGHHRHGDGGPAPATPDQGHRAPDRPDHGPDHGHDHPGGVRGSLRSHLVPHGHDAGEAIAAALTATDEGVRALKISLAVLAVTAGVELAVVVVSGSVALLSDTIHNFADALTAVPLGVAFWMSRRPATERYTYGFGRAEDLAGIFIVAVMAASSALAGWEAVDRLAHPRTPTGLAWVAAAGFIGFLGNETVAVYRIRVGRRIGSAALVADGLHARTDGLTSLAVVAGAAAVGAGWTDADPVVGLLITAAILVVLKDAARDIYRRLMDSVDPALVREASEILSQVQGVEQVNRVRLRWLGHDLLAEADIAADGGLSLAQGHDVAEAAHHQLLHRLPRLSQATIHVDPAPVGDAADPHGLTAHHFPGRGPAGGAVRR